MSPHSNKPNAALREQIQETKRMAALTLPQTAPAVVTKSDLEAMEKLAEQDRHVDEVVHLHEKLRKALEGLGNLSKQNPEAGALQNFSDTEYQIRKQIGSLMA